MTSSPTLEDSIIPKVLAGERITPADALEIYRHAAPADLAALADARRNQAKASAYGGKGNETVTYIIDRNINYTNVCNVYCKFCAFYRTERDADHYVLSLDEIDRKLDELTAVGGIQILMQGGHHPKLGIDWYLELLSATSGPSTRTSTSTRSARRSSIISRRCSGCRCARSSRNSRKRAWARSRAGAGEILVDRVRNRIAPLKCDSDHWLEAMAIAHELGLSIPVRR